MTVAEFVQIEGLAQVTAALRSLPAEFASNRGGPIRRALFRAADLIKQEAIARAPRDTGNLAQQIYVFRDRNPRASTGATERYLVAVRSGQGKKTFSIRTRGRFAGRSRVTRARDAFYWRFLEFGTEKQPPQPFMRPAFENKKRDAVVEFAAVMKSGVEGAVRRARKAGFR